MYIYNVQIKVTIIFFEVINTFFLYKLWEMLFQFISQASGVTEHEIRTTEEYKNK